MRVAMVGPFGFHPNKTMRSRALPLARALTTLGHHVAMFMPPWQTPEQAGRTWTEEGVTIHYVRLSGGVPATTWRLVRQVLATDPDVVHAFKPKAYSGLVAWWLWTFRRKRAALVTDSDDWEGWGGWNDRAPYSWWQKRFFAWQERWGLRHHHALTVASRTLESLAWAAGVAPARVFYLPNGPGIDPAAAADRQPREALGLPKGPILLLYSRLFEFDTTRLVQIVARVCERVPELAVLSVGGGLYATETAALRRQLDEAGLLGRIVDVGWQEEDALPGILAAADVGLYLMDDTLLNRTKCPVKLADMAAVGLPVVAEAVGQVPAYVRDGRTGRLRPSGDVAGLAADLIDLLGDRKERARLGGNAAAHVKAHFSWDRLAQEAERAYECASGQADIA